MKKKRQKSYYLKATSLLAATSVASLLGDQVVQAEEQTQGSLPSDLVPQSAQSQVETSHVALVNPDAPGQEPTTEVAIEVPELTYTQTTAVEETSGSLAITENAAVPQAAPSPETVDVATKEILETEAGAEVAKIEESQAVAPAQEEAEVSFSPVQTPYMTIERYEQTQPSYNLNGSTVEVVYKTGLTYIGADEVELTPDAAALGLTYDPVGQYIRGSIPLDGTFAAKNYIIGLQSKVNPENKATLDLRLESHLGLSIGRVPHAINRPMSGNDAIEYRRWAGVPVQFEDSDYASRKYVDSDDRNRAYKYDYGTGKDVLLTDVEVSKISMPVTTFGYFMEDGQTVADATAQTPQYYNEITVISLDDRRKFTTPLKVKEYIQTGGSDGVKLELITVYDAEQMTGNASHSEDTTPYYLRFTDLPEKAGSYFVTFTLEDNLGLKKNFRLNFTTYEQSRATNGSGLYPIQSLTNVDVRYTGNPDYTFKNSQGVDLVQVPVSDEEQILATAVLNKENATVAVTKLADGLEFDAVTNAIKKKAGVTLQPGIYHSELRAIDGHFGDNAPSRTFTFEVTDMVSPIDHQFWQQGQAIAPLPISLQSGSEIVSVEVRQPNTDYSRLKGNSDNKTVEGESHSQTPDRQTATVVVGYTNNQGGTSYTQRDFTYEVQPVSLPISLEVTNASQSLIQGDSVTPMVITKSDEANLVVDTTSLPRGLSYDAQTQTISGRALDDGAHRFVVRAEKDGKFVEKTVTLTVNPGPFIVDNIATEVKVGQALPDNFGLAIPVGSTVTWSGNAKGVSVNNNNPKLTGTPTFQGTATLTATISRVNQSGSKQSTTATATIKVSPRLLSLIVDNPYQTVTVGQPIQAINVSAEGNLNLDNNLNQLTSNTGYSFSQLGLVYNAENGSIIGNANIVGRHTFTVKSYYNDAYTDYREQRIEKTFTLDVKPIPVNLELSNNNQTVAVGENIAPIVVSHNPEAIITLQTAAGDLAEDRLKLYLQDEYGLEYDIASNTVTGRLSEKDTIQLRFIASNPSNYGGVTELEVATIKVVEDNLALSVSNDRQLVLLGTDIRPMVITHTADASLTVDEQSLPAGVTYEPTSKTLSGKPTSKGSYDIRVTAEKNGKQVSEIITLDVVEIPKLKIEIDPDDGTWIIDGVDTEKTSRGDKGDTGATGATGEKGEQGTSGQDGQSIRVDREEKDQFGNTVVYFTNGQSVTISKGDKGDTGATGATGATGEKGAAGQDGRDGESISVARTEFDPAGNTVVHFTNGQNVTISKGDKGDTGATGATGATGEKGEQGLQGVAGQDGRDGESIRVDREERDQFGNTVVHFTNGQSVTISKGDKGDTGATGATGEKGEQGLQGVAGQDGQSISVARTEFDPAGNTVVHFTNGQSVTISKGDKGDTGATGATGEKGEQGVAGRDGESISIARTDFDPSGNTVVHFTNGQSVTISKGDKGDTGATGATGEKGEQGVAGQDGRDGESISIARTEFDPAGNTVVYFTNGQSVTISKGDKGDTGATGATGEKGEQGIAGQDGRDGKSVLSGVSEPLAEDGKVGDLHINATTGDVSVKGNGAWIVIGNLKGAAGQDGASVITTATIPDSQTGKDGDTHVNTLTGDVSVRSNGVWSVIGNLKGAKGDKGDTGATGEKGEQGLQGVAGQDGRDGESISVARTEFDPAGNTVVHFTNGQSVTISKGDKGDTGATGEKGEQGLQGVAGQNGRDGESIRVDREEKDQFGNTIIHFTNGQSVTISKGDKGDTGATGATGEKGEQGLQGVAGQDGRDGRSIYSGISNPETSLGQDGETYVNATSGDVFTKSNGNWNLIGNIKGSKGDAGQDGRNGQNGNSILSGTIPPSAQEGNNGDLHINAKTGEISRKENNAWVVISSTDSAPSRPGNVGTGTSENPANGGSGTTGGNTGLTTGTVSIFDPNSGNSTTPVPTVPATPATGGGVTSGEAGGTGTTTSATNTESTPSRIPGNTTDSSNLQSSVSTTALRSSIPARVSQSDSGLSLIDSRSFVEQEGGRLTNSTFNADSSLVGQTEQNLPSTGDNTLSFVPLAGFAALLFSGSFLRKRDNED